MVKRIFETGATESVFYMTRLNNAIYKYYLTTLIFILILFKRQIPKWMRENAKRMIEPELVMGQVEKYVK